MQSQSSEDDDFCGAGNGISFLHSRVVRTNLVVSKTLGVVKVEHEEEPRPLVNNHLVTIMLSADVLARGGQPVKLVLQTVHGRVKVVQVTIAEELVVNQIELAASVVIAVAIPCTWEVQPLWVSKFIPNEIEIPFSSQRVSQQPKTSHETKPKK